MTAKEPTQLPINLTLDQALQQAIIRHQAGQLKDAEYLYRVILQTQPNHPDAHHNLGVLAVQVKQPAAGLPHFKAALEANPNQGQYLHSYIEALIQADQVDLARQILEQSSHLRLDGNAADVLTSRSLQDEPSIAEIEHLAFLFNQGLYTESENLARVMINRFPGHGFGWKVLGAVFKQNEKFVESLVAMQQTVKLMPEDAEAHSNLGVALRDLGKLSEAEVCYRRALEIRPDYAQAHSNLGAALKEQGRLIEAEASYRRALEIKPDYAQAHSNLGAALKEQGRLTEAEACYRRTLEIRPDFAEVHNNLGAALMEQGRLVEAEASYRRALEIKPDFAEVLSNLGAVHKEQGRLTEVEASYRRALEIRPDFFEARSNLLFVHNYTASHTPANCLEEARQYGQMVDKKVRTRFSNWRCATSPQRLRIGIVSGDLRNHPVGYFLESLLSQLDPTRIELIAYSTDHKVDELTMRIEPYFTAWKLLLGHNDEAAADLIHADGVHVLIDLAGHSANNRLPLFAWKPAPVQVSWLGYFATTGVEAIDYLIADPWVLPESEEVYFTERIWRLPETRLCFTPPDRDVKITLLPALTNGYITFGCFNNLTKLNDDVVALWARVLTSVPHSRLFLKAKQLKDASIRKNIAERFAVHGIEASQLILEGSEPREQYLAAYHRIDIALDPFPYPGGTTSVESLWMGVPVLTLAGERFLSRQGVGLLMNAGLPEWIAVDVDDYLMRAVLHANDLQRLAMLRKEMRQQVLASPIFGAKRFACYFEAALCGMWREWCERQ